MVDEIVAAGGDERLYTLDLGKRDQVKAVIDAVAQDSEGSTSSCTMPLTSFRLNSRMPDKVLDQMFDVGVKACFWLTKDVLP